MPSMAMFTTPERSQARPLSVARTDDEGAVPAQEPATALLSNVSYERGTVVHWDPEAMKLL